MIPEVIGATGTISKSFTKYVGNILGSHEVQELQKTAILGTAHILRKVLTYKTIRTNAGTREISTIHRIDNKRKSSCNSVSPRDMVCLGDIRVNTLFKGDNDDDNNNNRAFVGVNH